jgi:AI-2E family transporter
MDSRNHIRVAGFALKNWAVAQMQDSIAVALLWLVGLWILKVPWAPFWALLAAALQIIPHLGPVLGLVGPVLAALLHWQDWEHPFYVLVLYAVIVFVDGFLLQHCFPSDQRRGQDSGLAEHYLRVSRSAVFVPTLAQSSEFIFFEDSALETFIVLDQIFRSLRIFHDPSEIRCFNSL